MQILPSVFPQLFDFIFWVPFLFRLLIGATLLVDVWKLSKSSDADCVWSVDFGIPLTKPMRVVALMVGFGAGGALLLGVGTQVAAIVGASYFGYGLWLTQSHGKGGLVGRYLTLLMFITLSLLVLGPGPFAFDLPL